MVSRDTGSVDVTNLVGRFLSGDRRALARVLSMVENETAGNYEVLSSLYPRTGRTHVVGFTGSPGAGKSSMVDKLITVIRGHGLTVGILAVDPSSPFSGGAILGDRIRMQDHIMDRGVYMRSLATRGSLGGLSRATRDAICVMDAFGFDVILLETVGVGQTEVDVFKVVDSTVVVLTPAGGDGIQAIKAGIMEIGHVFAVNKGDLPKADDTVAEINGMLDMGHDPGGWRPPVVKTVATASAGIEDLWAAIGRHRLFLQESGQINTIRAMRMRQDLVELLEREVRQRVWAQVEQMGGWDRLVANLSQKSTDPYTLARNLVGQVIGTG